VKSASAPGANASNIIRLWQPMAFCYKFIIRYRFWVRTRGFLGVLLLNLSISTILPRQRTLDGSHPLFRYQQHSRVTLQHADGSWRDFSVVNNLMAGDRGGWYRYHYRDITDASGRRRHCGVTQQMLQLVIDNIRVHLLEG